MSKDRDSDPTALPDVLAKLFQDVHSPLHGPYLRWKIWKRWPDLVGPTISAHSEPVGLQKGVLVIWVKGSSWMQQMSFMKGPLLETLNKKLAPEKISGLRFTLNRNEVPVDPAERDALASSLNKLTE